MECTNQILSQGRVGASSGRSNRVVVQYVVVCIAILNLVIFHVMKQSELDCKLYRNNLVHLLMLVVPAVGSAKNRAVISGEPPESHQEWWQAKTVCCVAHHRDL